MLTFKRNRQMEGDDFMLSINPIQERQRLRSVKRGLDQIPHVRLETKVSRSRFRKLRGKKKRKKEAASFTSECLFLRRGNEIEMQISDERNPRKNAGLSFPPPPVSQGSGCCGLS